MRTFLLKIRRSTRTRRIRSYFKNLSSKQPFFDSFPQKNIREKHTSRTDTTSPLFIAVLKSRCRLRVCARLLHRNSFSKRINRGCERGRLGSGVLDLKCRRRRQNHRHVRREEDAPPSKRPSKRSQIRTIPRNSFQNKRSVWTR